MTMRAARLYGREDLRVEEVPVPEAGSGEVLLRVKAAAVCGTDIRMFRNGARGATPGNPLVLGHEVSGIVESVGPGVRGYYKGMPVAVAPNMGCGVCDQCVSGNTQMCATSTAFGINIPGGFAPFMKIPAGSRHRRATSRRSPRAWTSCLPRSWSRCPASTMRSRESRSSPGTRCSSSARGPSVSCTRRSPSWPAPAKVYMNDRSAERLSLCQKMEPAIIAIESGGLKERIAILTHGQGVSVCITAAPSGDAQVLARKSWV